MTSTNKVRVLKSTENNIESSIFPLRKWIQLIGISAVPKSSGNLISFSSYIYRFTIWFLSLVVNSGLLYYPLYEYSHSKMVSVTTHWVEMINCATKTAHTVGIHTVILFLFNGRWNQLIESLNETENRYGLKRINYRRVWQLSFAGVVYIIIMVNI